MTSSADRESPGSRAAALQARFRQGLALHQQGRLAEAERVYLEVLRHRPDHFDSLHMLGVVALQSGRAARGVELIGRATQVRPDSAAAHVNLGNGLRAAGRPAEALASYERALVLKPEAGDVHFNRGNALMELERPEEAIGAYTRAIELLPGHAEAWYSRGNAQRGLGRLEEAVASYDRAIAFKPDHAEVHSNRASVLMDLQRPAEALAGYERARALMPESAQVHYNSGNALMALERYEDALAAYDRVVALDPDHAGAYNNRGNALRELERPDEALASYDRAVALRPNHAEGYSNRGVVLAELGRVEEALAGYNRALALEPGNALAHANRGTALRELGRLDEALESLDAAIAIQPDHIEALQSRGLVLLELMRIEEALESFNRAVAAKPDDAYAQWSLASCLLVTGQYAEGWAGYEWRKRKKKRIGARSYPKPRFSGSEEVAGRTVFVHAEQGLGDTIQFCRYARLLAARGAKVVMAVQDPLCRLMRQLGPGIRIIRHKEDPGDFDFYEALISLPGAFGTVRETIPADIPYLAAEPDRVAAWKDRLGEGGFRIGICWQGSTRPIDKGRSFALTRYAGIASIPGVRLISLQKNDGAEQLDSLPEGMRVETLGDDFDSGPDAFVDTAAVMQHLDLVISSDTSIAHLAGALGRPVWVALKRVPDWRWLLEGTDCPWYPTMRLFRQPAQGDWAPVFDEMRVALTETLARAGPRRLR